MKYIKLFETPDGTYQPDIQEIIFNEINYPKNAIMFPTAERYNQSNFRNNYSCVFLFCANYTTRRVDGV